MGMVTMTDAQFQEAVNELLAEIATLMPAPEDPQYARRAPVVLFVVQAARAEVAHIRRHVEHPAAGPRPFRAMVPRGALLQ